MNKEIMDAIMKIKNMELRTTIAGYIIAQEYVIQQLKEKVKNAIIPKFKIGQKVYYIDCDYAKGTQDYEFKVICTKIINFSDLQYQTDLPSIKENKKTFRSTICYEDELFETKEEAEAKLKELE